MITFSKLGKHGNLGNQLFQLASLRGLATKYGCDMVVPPWRYASYFLQPPEMGTVAPDLLVEEPYYHYTPEFWDEYARDFRDKNVDILGWLQSERYWEDCNEQVRDMFRFNKELVQHVRARFRKVLTKETIAISIRRGDFATHPGFYLLPLEYYLQALQAHFPEHAKKHIIIFSDDFAFCKTFIRRSANVFFASGADAIEQLCLMSLCDHFIISNSSFSWWGAWLGEQAGSIIVRSPFHLAGDMLKTFDNKDYYPARWQVYDHSGAGSDISGFRNPPYAIKLNRLRTVASIFLKRFSR